MQFGKRGLAHLVSSNIIRTLAMIQQNNRSGANHGMEAREVCLHDVFRALHRL
jgi:hypothetical protein